MGIYDVTAAGKRITGTQKDTNNRLNVKKGADDVEVKLKQRGSGNQDVLAYADDGKYDITRQQGKGRLLDEGHSNEWTNINNSLANSSQSIFRGSYADIKSFTGSSGTDTIRIAGSNNKARNINTGAGADTLTVVGNNNDVAANLGAGDDVLNVRGNKVNVDGGTGNNRVWLGEGTTGSIRNFKNIYAGDNNAPTTIADALKKNANGSYQLKLGDIDVNLGSDKTAKLKFKDGTEKTLEQWLSGTTTTTPATGEINQSDLGYVGGADTIDGKGKKLIDLNLAGGDDKLTVNKDSEGTVDGGAGNDTVILMDGLNKYDILYNTDGSYKLTHKDTAKALNLSNFESFHFGNGAQEISAADLKNWVAPVYGNGADEATLDKAANAVTANQNTLAGNDVFNYKAGATGYTLNGGDGVDLFNAFDYQNYADDDALKTALTGTTTSQVHFGGSRINSDVENFKFNVGGTERTFTWAQLLSFFGL